VTTSGTPAPLCTFRPASRRPITVKTPAACDPHRPTAQGTHCPFPRQRHAVANEFLSPTRPGDIVMPPASQDRGRAPWPPGWESSKRNQRSVRGIRRRRWPVMPVVQYLAPSAPIVHAAVPASTALRGSSPVTGRGAPAVTAAHCAGQGRGHVPVLAFVRIQEVLPAGSACRAGYARPGSDVVPVCPICPRLAASPVMTTGTTKRAVARRSSTLVWSTGLGIDGL
jgi:hypothetical protein